MVVRKFYPGSEWLYIKIYTGVKTADIILEEAVIPLINSLQKGNFISKWFFIRYNDSRAHLRLRFLLADINKYHLVLEMINFAVNNFVESGEVANLILDSYIRELERYGSNTIELVEDLFYRSSEVSLNFLKYDDEERLVASIFYIDHILKKLQSKFPEIEIRKWIKDFNMAFKKEFNANKYLNNQLDKKFRSFKLIYQKFIDNDEFEESRNMILSNISKTFPIIEQILPHIMAKTSSVSLPDLFHSIFHMHINRTFISNQRLFEMVIYDHLLRYYKIPMLQQFDNH